MNRLSKVGVAFYVVCVIIFSYQPGMAYVTALSSVLIFAIAALMMFASKFVGVRQSCIRRVAYGWLIWLAWAAFGAYFALDIVIATEKLTTLLLLFVVFAAYSKLLQKEAARNVFRSAFIYTMLGVCALTAAQPEAFSDASGRMFGTFGNANAFGASLVFASVFESSRLMERSSFHRLCRFLAIQSVIVYFVFQTGSREAFIALVTANTFYISTIILGQAVGKKKYWAILIAIIVLLSVWIFGAIFSNEWSESRIGSFVSGIFDDSHQPMDGSASERLYFYHVAVQVLQQHFLVGVGLDNFRVLSGTTYGSSSTYAHSTYLEMLVATGVIGFLLYFSLYARVTLYIFRIWRFGKGSKGRAEAIKLSALVLAVVMLDFVDVTYYSKIFWLIFCYVLSNISEIIAIGGNAETVKVSSKNLASRIARGNNFTRDREPSEKLS